MVAVHVGIDLAWNTKARTGLAVVDDAGGLVDSATLRTDDEIVAWLNGVDWSPVTVAVDAPLIVTNATGQRDCERLISQCFGRYQAYCHSSNLSRPYFNPPRGATLAARSGWRLDPDHRGTRSEPACIEVYPHPSMVGLFKLGAILPYKARRGRSPINRRSAFLELMDHMESLSVMGLTAHARWADLRTMATGATTQAELERIEDEIDAIFCAHLAWLWSRQPGRLRIYGDLATGYIVATAPPSHPATKRPTAAIEVHAPEHGGPAASLPIVDVQIVGRPASYSTASTAPWKAAVSAEVGEREVPAGVRFCVEIDFRLPTPRTSNDALDIDNLVKPTLDALGGVIGWRLWNGARQADDERVDELHAMKRTVRDGEQAGASIQVRALPREAGPSTTAGTTNRAEP
jgi:predicted RNase H-like nuclease/Holliday junction resolvase RusA-like endonuclease